MPSDDLTLRWHPEKGIDNFSKLDGTIRFYSFVKAILLKLNAKEVLDFGAGRGEFWFDEKSGYRRQLRDLRTYGANVTACDIDDAVRGHPCSHNQVVIRRGEPLPFYDEAFDVIVSDMTFEHLEDVDHVTSELLRVLKPGGYVCARTPNRLGYVRMISSLIPNALHRRVLRYIQPSRKEEDIFPTFYRLNSPEQARCAFKDCVVWHYYDNAEPAYFFGSNVLYGLFMLIHALLPPMFSTSVCLFVHKKDSTP
jgi:SAM-dependent methyltransferase